MRKTSFGLQPAAVTKRQLSSFSVIKPWTHDCILVQLLTRQLLWKKHRCLTLRLWVRDKSMPTLSHSRKKKRLSTAICATEGGLELGSSLLSPCSFLHKHADAYSLTLCRLAVGKDSERARRFPISRMQWSIGLRARILSRGFSINLQPLWSSSPSAALKRLLFPSLQTVLPALFMSSGSFYLTS